MWGYPNGMRGKNLSNIYKSIETIKRYVIKYRYDGEKLFEKLSGIKGLGLSTITKILYFFQIKCGNQYIPILDSHVINSMDFFEDFDGVHQNNRGWIFIKETAAIFNGVDGIKYDDLEYYLFELDKKWEKHIKEFKREQLETLTRELIP